MSVTKPPVKQQPSGPPEKESPAQPFLALSVAVVLAAATGLLADWTAAVTVFSAVSALLTTSRR
jgi:hypothetical protein